jgi:hypothetical protein
MALPEVSTEQNITDALHYSTDSGYILELSSNSALFLLRAQTTTDLERMAIASLKILSEHHWSNKTTMVALARACGINVTTSMTVDTIKTTIANS